MNNLKTLLTAALMSVALGSAAFADDISLTVTHLYQDTPKQIVVKMYLRRHPNGTIVDFNRDNPHIAGLPENVWVDQGTPLRSPVGEFAPRSG